MVKEWAIVKKNEAAKLQKLQHYIQSLCGIYSRIARRLGVDRTYVSRVAKGERRSPKVETALIQEFDRSQHHNDD
jgi:transcriptional regulator with XRE-family HTH domain